MVFKCPLRLHQTLLLVRYGAKLVTLIHYGGTEEGPLANQYFIALCRVHRPPRPPLLLAGRHSDPPPPLTLSHSDLPLENWNLFV